MKNFITNFPLDYEIFCVILTYSAKSLPSCKIKEGLGFILWGPSNVVVVGMLVLDKEEKEFCPC